MQRCRERKRNKVPSQGKDEQIREYYTRFDAFYFKGEDGLYYDDEGNAGEIEDELQKKNAFITLANKFGFASPRAASRISERYSCALKTFLPFEITPKNKSCPDPTYTSPCIMACASNASGYRVSSLKSTLTWLLEVTQMQHIHTHLRSPQRSS